MIGDNIINIILEYSLIIFLGNNSPNSNITIEIGINVRFEEIKLFSNKYIVQNDEHKIFESVVPIKLTIKNLDFLFKIFLVNSPSL